jgi:hypothetical protein
MLRSASLTLALLIGFWFSYPSQQLGHAQVGGTVCPGGACSGNSRTACLTDNKGVDLCSTQGSGPVCHETGTLKMASCKAITNPCASGCALCCSGNSTSCSKTGAGNCK